MVGEAWRQSEKKAETQYRINATMKLYNKTRQIMLDSLPLFENGALPSCFILWRSMYENYVFSMYLLGSPDEESNRFNDYAKIQTECLSSQYNKKQFAEFKELLEKKGASFMDSFGWITVARKKSISGIIKHTKEKKFANYYQFASMQIHASPFSVNNSILHQEGHGNTEMLGSFSEDIAFPYNLNVKLIEAYIEMMAKFFLVDQMKELIILSNHVLAVSTGMETD